MPSRRRRRSSRQAARSAGDSFERRLSSVEGVVDLVGGLVPVLADCAGGGSPFSDPADTKFAVGVPEGGGVPSIFVRTPGACECV